MIVSYLQCPVTWEGHSMQLWRTLLMRWSRFCVGNGVDPTTSSYRMHPRDHWREGSNVIAIGLQKQCKCF